MVRDRFDTIERIEMETQEPAIRIIDKKGPLKNFADRDHCLQYMAAVGLIFGRLTAQHYTDEVAQDPQIDRLRNKMVIRENPNYTRDYYDLEMRAISNSMQVFFEDGTHTERVEVHYPVGHRFRRDEGIPLLEEKFINALPGVFELKQMHQILEAFDDPDLEHQPISEFLSLFVKPDPPLRTMLA
jgi:2-methylcitrate dehydratase